MSIDLFNRNDDFLNRNSSSMFFVRLIFSIGFVFVGSIFSIGFWFCSVDFSIEQTSRNDAQSDRRPRVVVRQIGQSDRRPREVVCQMISVVDWFFNRASSIECSSFRLKNKSYLSDWKHQPDTRVFRLKNHSDPIDHINRHDWCFQSMFFLRLICSVPCLLIVTFCCYLYRRVMRIQFAWRRHMLWFCIIVNLSVLCSRFPFCFYTGQSCAFSLLGVAICSDLGCS